MTATALHVQLCTGHRCMRGAAQALRFFEHAKVDQAFDAPALWDKMAQCQTLLGRREDALSLYRTVVDGALAAKQAVTCGTCCLA